MRYQVTKLQELIDLLPELDDDDRIGFVVYDEDKKMGENKFEYTFRFSTNFIKIHEVKQIK